MTIGEALSAALSDWGDHPCLIEVTQRGTIETSSRKMLDDVAECSTRLHDLGIRRGFFVPLFLDNSARFITVFLSLLRLGAVPVMVKMEYRSMELDEIFRNSQPEAVIAEKHHVPFLRPHLAGAAVLTLEDGVLTLLQPGDRVSRREDVPPGLASVNYTYRGYGYPLGAMITHGRYLHGARVLQDTLAGRSGERMLIILPMVHIFTLVGCILAPLLHGMTSVIPDTMHPRRLFSCMSDFRIDYLTSVPEFYSLLARLRDPSEDLSSLKAFVSGGSLLSKEDYGLITRAFSVDLLHGYGLTEVTPVSGNMRGQPRAGTVGPLCSGVTCRIDLPRQDGVGEILVKAPEVSAAYYRRPSESRDSQSDGWFRTGDTGRFDEDHLVFAGEMKNTRKVNGNMVDLAEVARAIRRDPDVDEVRVGWEQNELFADLGMRRQVDFDEKVTQLRTSLRGTIAGYKIPRKMRAL